MFNASPNNIKTMAQFKVRIREDGKRPLDTLEELQESPTQDEESEDRNTIFGAL